MNIEDAFTQLGIEAAGVDVEGELETELRDVIHRVYQQVPEGSDAVMDIGMLCFVAGRAYQSDQLSQSLLRGYAERVKEYMDFLVERGEA